MSTPSLETIDPARIADMQMQLKYEMAHPAFDRLAGMFGASLPEPDEDGRSRLDALAQVAADHWDFRKGAERQATDWDQGELGDPDSPRGRQVARYTGGLGLVASTHPILPSYGKGVGTGAANLAPLQRVQYMEEQNVKIGEVVLLGSDRPVGDNERPKTETYAPNAVTEFDLMCGAAQRVYGVRAYEEVLPEVDQVGYDHAGVARVRRYDMHDKKITVFDAPAPVGARRANTLNTLTFMRTFMGDKLGSEVDILNSTNAFYAPFQDLAARQGLTLPIGACVETIGFDAKYGGVVRKPSQLLNETKSYVDAAVRLDKALRQARAGV